MKFIEFLGVVLVFYMATNLKKIIYDYILPNLTEIFVAGFITFVFVLIYSGIKYARSTNG